MKIVEKIDQSIRLGEAHSKSESINDLLADAKVLRSKLQGRFADYYSILHNFGVMRKSELIDSDEALDIIDTLKDILKNVQDSRFDDDRLGLLERECNALESEMDSKWKDYIKREIGSQKDIVDALQALIQDTQRYLTLKSKYNDITSTATPGSQEVMGQIKTYKILADKMIQEMGLEDSILLFFKKLSQRQTLPLTDLTPEVLNWISENNFEDKFSIKLSE